MKHILRILSVSLIAALVSCSACSKSDGTSSGAADISAAITSEQETTAITASAVTAATAATATTAATEPEMYSAQYKLVVDAFDWGPASTKAIVSLPESCTESDLCSFAVTETTPDGKTVDRTVSDVYLCDSEGSRITGTSKYLAIDMEVVPCGAGSVFRYDMSDRRNKFSDKYQLDIKPADGATGALSSLTIDPVYTDMVIPDLSAFQIDSYTEKDITLNYGLYTLEEDDSTHPLIVWCHGFGEGGDDPEVALLGNRVTAFAEEDIQDAFDGAYVLIPQCPTFWYQTASSASPNSEPDGSSIYSEPLMGLIEKILSENEGIDPDRIYIGGCSSGGYMTMSMILAYPDTFAAAFPVCSYYPDKFIDDQELAILENTPLWYVYCTSDTSEPPKPSSEATISRLEDAGVSVHASIYEDVHDITGLYTDAAGEPFVYNNHFSWIYVLNSYCRDGDLSLWEYLASQSSD
jgi:predicted peptidase